MFSNSNDVTTEKIIIGLLIIGFIYLLFNKNSLKENEYIIEINDPYVICGKEIYFTNNSYDKEINIRNISEDILYACGIEK